MPLCQRGAVVAAALVCFAHAHLPLWESERQNIACAAQTCPSGPVYIPAPAPDFSFRRPLQLTSIGGETSVVIETLLNSPRDLDVFRYEKSDARSEALYGFATAPGCTQYERFRPALTLMGPRLRETGVPIDDPRDLPFAVPLGYDAYTAREPPPAAYRGTNLTRQLFVFENARLNVTSSWWMPPMYSNECLNNAANPPSECSYDYAVRVNVTRPGNYYWVIWAPPFPTPVAPMPVDPNRWYQADKPPQHPEPVPPVAVSAVLGFLERLDLIFAAVKFVPPSNKPGIPGGCDDPPLGAFPVIEG